MRRDWANVGSEYNSTDEQKEKLAAAFAGLEWQEIPKQGSLQMPFSQGMAIRGLIDNFKLGAVSHVAESSVLAPFGLLGIRNHFKNGVANIYFVDEGWQCVTLAVDFYPNEEAAPESVGTEKSVA